MKSFPSHSKATALKAAIIYAFSGVLWIYASSAVPHKIIPEPVLAGRITLFLNSTFVVLTLAFFYKLTMLFFKQSQLTEEARLQVESQSAALENLRVDHQEALEKFSIITGSIPSLIAHMDMDQRFLYVNPGYAAWVGRPESEIVGRSAQEILGDNIYGVTEKHIDQALQGRFSCMERTVCIAGKDRIQHISFIPRLGSQNDVRSYFVLINDITEIRQAEDQLRHAHKMEAIGTMAGGVAHDFNNILTIIMGCAEMIHTNPESSKRMTNLIFEAANKGAALTQSLLAFSRKQEVKVTAIDLNSRVRKLENLLCRIIGEDISINLSLCGASLRVMADAEQFDQVVMNMVSNARDAMPNGGELKISTYLTKRSLPLSNTDEDAPAVPCAVLEIADTGSGMSRHTIERIFDPFYTTKEMGKGTGLGLSMAYGIIKGHNGHIEVDSTLGEGSVFRILLPRIDRGPETIGNELLPGLYKGDETILLVEDDSTVRHTLMAMLQSCGYRILIASDGEEGVMIYKNNASVSLILSDVIMPRKNGIEMCREIHAINQEVPVIFMSGYDAGMVEAFAANKQIVHYVPKPIKMPILLKKICQALEGASKLATPMSQAVRGAEDIYV